MGEKIKFFFSFGFFVEDALSEVGKKRIDVKYILYKINDRKQDCAKSQSLPREVKDWARTATRILWKEPSQKLHANLRLNLRCNIRGRM
jgi:hypothetical protein